MNENKPAALVKKFLGCLSLPVVCYVLIWLLCRSNGASVFVGGIGSNVATFFKSVCYFSLLCFAVSINLHTGRMCFDTGSIILLSTIVGFIVNIQTGDHPVIAFIAAIATGTILSTISGVLYILLRLPSMIVSLGTTLIYEALGYWLVRSFAYNGNVEMLSLKKEMTPAIIAIASNIPLMIIITLVATVFMIIIFEYTKIGYDYRSLQSGQKIATDTGVDEIKNALICYAISGALLGCAGIINYSAVKAVQPSLNFGSVALMFDCFCPMFFGGFLMRYTNKNLGILLGVIGYAFIQIGLGQVQIAQNWNIFVIPLINATIFVLFMIFQSNEGRLRAAIKGAKK